MKKKKSSNQSPDGKVSLLSPKKTLNSNTNGGTSINNGITLTNSSSNNCKGAVSPKKFKFLK